MAQTIKAPQPPTRREATRRRKALGWSQNSWARRAGKPGSFVSTLMSGKVHSPGAYRELIETLEIGERTGGAEPPDPGPE